MSRSITILKSRFSKQGGAEKYARCLAESFHQKGCKVTVLTTAEGEGKFPFEVISHKLKSKTSVGKLWEFDSFCTNYLENHPSDIVFGHDRNSFQTHLRAGSGVHRSFLEHRKQFEPTWLHFRHKFNPLHASILKLEKKGFEHPGLKVLFANSHLVKQEILSTYAIAPEKIHVIHNGVEWSKWQESFDEWQMHKTGNRFEFLFLGSNFERKGLGRLIAGLKALNKPDIHLSVVGKDKNQKKFEQMAKGLQVTFHGPQEDVRPFLQRADSLVIPSFYDPFANVTTEALAMGLFVVSSKTNGGSEVLTPTTGCIIEDMKAALETALQHPKTPESAQSIRNSVKHLDFSTQLRSYLEICLSTS